MKRYLGDGVYVTIDKDLFNTLILTTEDGISVSNKIVLEPEVLNNLLEFLQKLKETDED